MDIEDKGEESEQNPAGTGVKLLANMGMARNSRFSPTYYHLLLLNHSFRVIGKVIGAERPWLDDDGWLGDGMPIKAVGRRLS